MMEGTEVLIPRGRGLPFEGWFGTVAGFDTHRQIVTVCFIAMDDYDFNAPTYRQYWREELWP